MRVLPICVFLFTFYLSDAQVQEAIRPHKYAGDQELKLTGDWKLFWNQLYQEDSALIYSEEYVVIRHPLLWNGLTDHNGSGISAEGFATYYTEILSDQNYDSIAIWLPGFYSAQNTYLNGVKVSKDGRVGRTKETSSVSWIPQLVHVSLKKGVNELVIEVSNFHHFKGGFYLDVEIGKLARYQKMYNSGLTIDLFTAGAFFMIGFFFLGMYLFWRKSKLFILYTVFTIGYGIRILSSGNHIFKIVFTDMSWEWAVGIEYFSLFLVWWASFSVNSELYTKKVVGAINSIFILLMGLVLILPLSLYSQVLFPSILFGIACYVYAFILLFYKKNAMSLSGFLATLFFFLFAFAGWLMEFLLHSNADIMLEVNPNILRFLSVLALSFLVSDRYSTDYDEAERLREDSESKRHIIESQFAELKAQQGLLEFRNQKIETLLKEMHHRVKNNLQLIYSLLDMGDSYSEQNSKNILKDSQSRVATMALIHQNLYENDDLHSVYLADYIENLSIKIQVIYDIENKVNLEVNCDDFEFDVDTVIPLGLIITELLTNAFKYGFTDKKELKIEIALTKSEDHYTLTVSDNGVNLPAPLKEIVKSGYGLKLANRLARQLQGQLKHKYARGNVFTIYFKDTVQRKTVL